MGDEQTINFAPDESFPNTEAMLDDFRRLAASDAYNAGLVALTPDQHAAQLAAAEARDRAQAEARIRHNPIMGDGAMLYIGLLDPEDVHPYRPHERIRVSLGERAGFVSLYVDLTAAEARALAAGLTALADEDARPARP